MDRDRNSSSAARPHRDSRPVPEPAVAAVVAPPAFQERALVEEGHAAAFRIEVGGGWATGTLPAGAGENEIAKFLGEAIGLAKQMQVAMAGESAEEQILIADPAAGALGQSAIKVSIARAGGTAVTLQSGGSGHLVTMLQHFLLALNAPPREATPQPTAAPRPRIPGWPYAPLSARRAG